MTIVMFANVITAFIAFVLMLLVTIGFAPHLKMRGHDANSFMSLFVAGSSGLVWGRLLWWSLLRPLIGWMGWLPTSTLPAWGHVINAGFNFGAIIVALAGLAALHRSLPLSERTQYNWLTVPFYPRRFALIWRW